MDRFNALSRGTQLMLAAGVLLLVDTFLNWQKVSAEVGGVEIASFTRNAWHGFWGVVLGLLVIALLAWFVATMVGVTMRLPVSETLLTAALGALIFIFALLKALTDDFSTMWAWIGVVLAGLVAAGAWLRVQEAGGMDTLRTEASALGGSAGQTRPEAPPPAEDPPT
ncbi:MAG: hypothetical protein WD067_10750 [Gaiellaceae bacterium]